MRKWIACIYGLGYALFGGLLLQCGIDTLGNLMSPFSASIHMSPETVGGALAAIFALLAVTVANIRFFMWEEHIKQMLQLEAVICATLILPFWAMWDRIFDLFLP